jgi:hypothetical protein
LEVCGALGDILKIVARQLQLVLDVLGGLNLDTGMHDDSSSDFLAQEVSVQILISILCQCSLSFVIAIREAMCVAQPPLGSVRRKCDIPYLNLELARLIVLLKIDVDGEMGVDVSHLVLVSLGNANDHVVDQ